MAQHPLKETTLSHMPRYPQRSSIGPTVARQSGKISFMKQLKFASLKTVAG